MEQGLIEQAKELGGQAAPIQGSLYVRIPMKKDPRKFWIVSFYFSTFEEMIALGKKCVERGYQPFTDVIDLKVLGTDVTLPRQEQGPSCPYHGDEFVKPSKKKAGTVYCQAQLLDGSFCKWST